MTRIHQEDVCQALGLPPTAKYQSEGGPSPELRLAMRIGSECRVEAITGRHWRAFAVQNGLDPERTVARIDDLAGRLPAAFREAAGAGAVVGRKSGLPERLAAAVEKHAAWCRKNLA